MEPGFVTQKVTQKPSLEADGLRASFSPLCCAVLCLVALSCPTPCDPMDCSPPGSSVHGSLQARTLEWVAMPSSRASSKPGIEPRSPPLQADSLLSYLPGKPKNTGVGSLSLCHGIFPTQESNWGLQHCRWILYQLSYQGSPLLIPMKVSLLLLIPYVLFFSFFFFKTMFFFFF